MLAHPSPIRVLVAEDSVVVRRLISDILGGDPQLEVVGVAKNGQVAVDLVAQLQPDAVTMDIEMPVMNGIDAVRALRATHPRLPIVMFSTTTERGAAATLDALTAGASDYVTKPANLASLAESQQSVREQLIPKIKALVGTRRRAAAAAGPVPPTLPRATLGRPRTGPFSVLAIGSSTGGPDALARVLAALPATLPVPVLVVQHMPPVFTRLLAQRLDGACALRVSEAEPGDEVLPGRVLIAPGGMHLVVQRRGAGAVARLSDDPPENFCRPAVDVLFRSVVSTYGFGVLGLVLTGMGRDGERGAAQIRAAGGQVVVQDEATSVVWGMPGAVALAGHADRVLPLPRIGTEVAAALAAAASRRAPSGVA